MSILARTRTVATKPTRTTPAKPLPFGAGIEPTPRPGAYGKTHEPGIVSDSSADVPIWANQLRRALIGQGYRGESLGAARSWIESRGTIKGCPVIDKGDWPWIDDLVERSKRPATRRASKTKPAPTAATVPVVDIPPPAGSYRPYQPTPEESQQAAEMFGSCEPDSLTLPFVERLDSLAKRYSQRDGAFFKFIGAELARTAQLASFLGATNPSQFEQRRDAADAMARGEWEQRGFDLGYASHLADHEPFDGRVD